MITFNLTKTTATPAINLIETLERILPLIANDYGIISTFCKIDYEVYSSVSALMPLIKDGGGETIMSVCNYLLSGDWAIEDTGEKYKCTFCENIFEDYDKEAEKFEIFVCPACSSDNYFDETKNKKKDFCNLEYEEESLRDKEELESFQIF